MTCWEQIRRSHLHESPNPMGQLGVVITQHQWAEVSTARAEELFEFVTKARHTVIVDSAVVNINSLERDGLRQAELCPRNTMMIVANSSVVPQRPSKVNG